MHASPLCAFTAQQCNPTDALTSILHVAGCMTTECASEHCTHICMSRSALLRAGAMYLSLQQAASKIDCQLQTFSTRHGEQVCCIVST